MTRVVVVGAGVGGLVTAGMLARAGMDVTVLEAHAYPGGCAGTFYHQGYRFDVGATLPAGFEPGGVMERLGVALGVGWRAELAQEAMVVHLPGGQPVTQWTDPERWRDERVRAFGQEGERFWRWQQDTAEVLWQAASRGVPWPPANAREAWSLAGAGASILPGAIRHLPRLAADAFRPVAAHVPAGADRLRQFVDAQLLISAQSAASRANALYGAAALDLPRRGVAHLYGGMGALGQGLAEGVRRQGGRILYHQRVTRVIREGGKPSRVETNKGASFPADLVVFNVPPWDAQALLNEGKEAPKAQVPQDGWGAFVLYAGIDDDIVPHDFALHHQVIVREPLGEGNSVFLTLSMLGDAGRAPAGKRAITMSTHTALWPWWDLYDKDRAAYEARKAEMTERCWAAAKLVLPGIRTAGNLALPGTPVTYQRFTQRSLGWVGGFPQTSLFRARGPRLEKGAWLTGDSIFPGQSALAVALGGQRVAQAILGVQRGAGAASARAWPERSSAS